DALPIFSAAFFSLAISTQRLEWIAVQAAGQSIRQIVLPLVIAAFGLAVLTAVLGETLLTRAAGGTASRLHRSTDQLTFRGGVFWHHSGTTIYKMAHANPSERTLRSVEIFRRTPEGRLKTLISAPHVRVGEDGRWHLEGAHIREFDPEHPERPAQISLNVDLELPPLSEDSNWLEETRPTTLSVPELMDYIAQQTSDRGVRAHAMKQRLTSLLHQRLTEPILVVVLTVLAIPFALRVTPGGSIGGPAIVGFGVLASFFFLRSLSQGLIIEGLLPPAVTLWVVPMAFALASLIALARTSRPH
ncbi:MAG: LptF/LptG family permease, partial [Myxococcota bacterium]